MEKVSLLILDDEPEVLNALKRTLRTEFKLFLFSDPIKALEFYRDQPFSLVMSDMRMPVMDGATFLTLVSKINPRSKRFLLTGHSDIDLTVAAVNDGKISHYFTKPWDNEALISQLKLAAESYNNELKSRRALKVNQQKNIALSLQNASMEADANKQQRQLLRLKRNFNVFIDIYADSIAMHTQDNSGHNYRIGAQARYLALQMGCSALTAFQIYVAGLLYETGKLALPQSILQQPYELLSPPQQLSFRLFFEQSATMLARVSQLADIVTIIGQIPQPFNDHDQQPSLNEHLSLGARILAVVIAFDNLIIGRQTLIPQTVAQAKQRIEQQANREFDGVVIKMFFDMLDKRPASGDEQLEFAVDLSKIGTDVVLARDVENSQHGILLTQGTMLTDSYIAQLTKLSHEQQRAIVLFIRAPSVAPLENP